MVIFDFIIIAIKCALKIDSIPFFSIGHINIIHENVLASAGISKIVEIIYRIYTDVAVRDGCYMRCGAFCCCVYFGILMI